MTQSPSIVTVPTGVMAPEYQMRASFHGQQEAFLTDLSPSRGVRDDRLRRLDRLIATHQADFAESISHDFGTRSPIEIRISETMLLQGGIRSARRHLGRWMKPRRVATTLAFRPGHSRVTPQPLGVVGIISPWNYPLQLALGPLIGALAAGNRAMIKPSELTPLFAATLQAAVADTFSPDEVTVITGDTDIGKAFAALPFDHLVFTGSTAVGRDVAQAAAKNLTPVTLELGGKSPAIIDRSCNMKRAADSLAWSKLLNAGQTCIAPDYALVPREDIDRFVQAVRASMVKLYPTFQGNPDYTSIASDRHWHRLRALIDDARSLGARVIEIEPADAAAPRAGRQLAPALLLDVTEDMQVMREEIFGPVLPIVPYDAPAAALAYVNGHDRPLALYWFGANRTIRDQVLAGTISGGVVVNDAMLHFAQEGLPFGGVGPSGHGHYHGHYGFRQFSKEKPVFVQSRLSGVGLLRPPYKPSIGRVLDWLSHLV
jgi:coniferyl-aldehyde dehydrogenase